ncbi:MAG: FAD-binding protein [Thermaerobacter sp.]|nr:FAD-binding protein [Thermaerobacter sp.]
MIRISNIKLPLEQRGAVQNAALKKLGLTTAAIRTLRIHKESVDARDKRRIQFVYVVDVELDDEARYLGRHYHADVALTPSEEYAPVAAGPSLLSDQPVIIGAGPAGMFAALLLAERGYRPLLLERGQDVDSRTIKVAEFWRRGVLDTGSNVQFGEGGAGTFSDGKLTTTIRDPRCRKVLGDLVAAGAPPEIMYVHKPHVGTDILRGVVKQIRRRIEEAGGEVRFGAQVTDLLVDRGAVRGVVINSRDTVPASVVVLAVGHSARDTFAMLLERGVDIVPKAFAIGARIEHAQKLVDEAQYGGFAGHPNLGPAEYKLAHTANSHRAAYTFCMCPGGAVVAAASEEGGVVTNGMSEQARDRSNANSALLVAVGPEDFFTKHPLAGVEFQRHWEAKAFAEGGRDYRAPLQTVGDFLSGRKTGQWGQVEPSYLPGVQGADLASCLPAFVVETMREALLNFDRKIKGFAHPAALLTGVETRSSSPVRIPRDAGFEGSVTGLYPSGEGAGYAGGIMSAAVDGIRVGEAIISKYSPARGNSNNNGE